MSKKNEDSSHISVTVNGEQLTKAVLHALDTADGYLPAIRLADKPPFNEILRPSTSELSEYPGREARYRRKKRNVLYQLLQSLNLADVIKKSPGVTTSATEYRLSEFGRDLIAGLKIIEAAKKKNVETEKIMEWIEAQD